MIEAEANYNRNNSDSNGKCYKCSGMGYTVYYKPNLNEFEREDNDMRCGKELDQLLALAIDVATKAHDGQLDKGGNPYILHP